MSEKEKKETFTDEDFLNEVSSENKKFVTNIHEALLNDGYKFKVESKASGFFIGYTHPKTKRSLLNFFFRKKGFFVRLYADNFGKYANFLKSLPDEMVKEIEKSPVCKRLINPDDCNSKCIKGYDFQIENNHFQKCRYSCFQFTVNSETIPVLSEFIEKEMNERKI